MENSLTAIVLTKNAQSTIKTCLESIRFCNEIIIIDDLSTDKTIQTIKSFSKTHKNVKIFEKSLTNDFSAQRNFGLEQASSDWVLYVDSDEVVSESLSTEIISTIYHVPNPHNGYYIQRIDEMWGKRLLHGENGNTYILRLAKKDKGKWSGKVHETWEIQGKTTQLKFPLYHFPHPTITEFLQEINFYTTLRSQELYEKKVPVSGWSILLHTKGKFWQDYLLKQGYLDGIEGFIFALFMSMHAFLVRGKLWLLYKKS